MGSSELGSSITRIKQVRWQKHSSITITTFRVSACVSAKIQPESPTLNLSDYFSVDSKSDFETYFALFLREIIPSESRTDVGHVLNILQDRFWDSLMAMNQFVAWLDVREDLSPLSIQNNKLINLWISFSDRVRILQEQVGFLITRLRKTL
jgi:hypothetical protein